MVLYVYLLCSVLTLEVLDKVEAGFVVALQAESCRLEL